MTKAAVKQRQPKEEELPPPDILTSINEPFAPVRNALRPFSINEPPSVDGICRTCRIRRTAATCPTRA